MSKEELCLELNRLLVKSKDPNADLVSIKKRLDYLLIELENVSKKSNSNNFLDIKSLTFDDPINPSLVFGLINNYLGRNGDFESRFVRIPGCIDRGNDYDVFEDMIAAEKESMVYGLQKFLKNIIEGNFESVNEYYYAWISRIGISKLVDFLNTDNISTPEMRDFLSAVYKNCYRYSNEKIGSFDKYSSLSKMSSNVVCYDYRFYINMPMNVDSVNFIKDYQIMCQEQNLDYCMKAFKNSGSKQSQDITILYASCDDVNKKLNIIKRLLAKYPNMELGNPPPACVNCKELPNIGISTNGVVRKVCGNYRNYRTYNDYINDISLCALTDLLSNKILTSSKFSKETKDYVRSFILGDRKSNFTFNEFGIIFTGSELEEVKKYLISVLCNSKERSKFADKFINSMHKYHNRANGYEDNHESNIALDSWYIDEKNKKYTY